MLFLLFQLLLLLVLSAVLRPGFHSAVINSSSLLFVSENKKMKKDKVIRTNNQPLEKTAEADAATPMKTLHLQYVFILTKSYFPYY